MELRSRDSSRRGTEPAAGRTAGRGIPRQAVPANRPRRAARRKHDLDRGRQRRLRRDRDSRRGRRIPRHRHPAGDHQLPRRGGRPRELRRPSARARPPRRGERQAPSRPHRGRHANPARLGRGHGRAPAPPSRALRLVADPADAARRRLAGTVHVPPRTHRARASCSSDPTAPRRWRSARRCRSASDIAQPACAHPACSAPTTWSRNSRRYRRA